jgi:NO-binding membrane sensor protein with MHYT domain
MEINYSIPLVALSYIVSVIGSFMALLVNRDALRRPAGNRGSLVFLSALCLGGVGIWSMHFIGMLAFHVHGMAITYNWWMTLFSLVLGVVVVYIGLRIMSQGGTGLFKLVLAGFFVGGGVAVMHYTGMIAMRMQAVIQWNETIIAASVGIAVTAAIVALWLAGHVNSLWQILASALVMGLAVCGMHYTGMTAATLIPETDLPFVPADKTGVNLLVLSIIAIDFLVILLASTMAMVEANKRSS